MNFRVLITSPALSFRSGVPIYVRDLALELQRQGHLPVVYTLEKGNISDELETVGIQVVNDIRHLNFLPDIIHGSNYAVTVFAVQYFPKVPAIFVCHDHTHWADRAPIHPRVHRYFGVSKVCIERLIKDGAPQKKCQLLLNFVDTRRFLPRKPLPERPRRALVFSNYASVDTHLPAIIEACKQTGLALDVAGKEVNKQVDEPEKILGEYDIVFAKAKAAMEAMAVGTSVVLCDFRGVGPIVNSVEFNSLRNMNFGFQALFNPLSAENIITQIKRYDADDVRKVRDLIRSSASVEQFVQNVAVIYREVIEEQNLNQLGENSFQNIGSIVPVMLFMKSNKFWTSISRSKRNSIKRYPIVRTVLDGIKKFLAWSG